MARPAQRVLQSRQVGPFELQVQSPKKIFVLTYYDEVCQIRKDCSAAGYRFKYVKTNWTSEKTAKRMSNHYNAVFGEGFGYRRIK
tara:strand:- start:4207 stop:4461 length:255 start_codon:yes stop_codon:yes gene_type:complete